MSVKITRDMNKILRKIHAGEKSMIPAVTEAVVEYGNVFVPEDQGVLEASSLIGTTLPDTVSRKDWTPEDQENYSNASGSDLEKGRAVWDTPYAKRRYYTGTPSKDKNQNASLQWVEKGVNTYKKELDQVAQNAFNAGMRGTKK